MKSVGELANDIRVAVEDGAGTGDVVSMLYPLSDLLDRVKKIQSIVEFYSTYVPPSEYSDEYVKLNGHKFLELRKLCNVFGLYGEYDKLNGD